MMFLRAFLVYLVLCGSAYAQVGQIPAYLQPAPSVSSYQGPGDLGVGSFAAWYSCARSYSAAYAAPGTNKACDVVDSSTGVTACTFHIQTTGFVNPAECNATACATACSVTKAYDQSGNSRDALNITLAQMPPLTFSALNGLPGMTCTGGGACLLATSGTFTIAQPITYTAVYKRTTGTATAGIIGDVNGGTYLGTGGAVNLAGEFAGTLVTVAATDNSFHSANGLLSGTGSNCALNIDGSDTAALACGTGGISAAIIRLNRTNGTQMQGITMEAGLLAATTTPTNRNAVSANQHSATNGYNF